MVAAVTPLRAGMPAKSNAFSLCSSSRAQVANAGRLLGDVGQEPAHLIRAQPGERTGGRGCPEQAAQRMRAAAGGIDRPWAQRLGAAAAEIVPQHQRAQQLCTPSGRPDPPWRAPPARRHCRDR
jgi:hypothetical protein